MFESTPINIELSRPPYFLPKWYHDVAIFLSQNAAMDKESVIRGFAYQIVKDTIQKLDLA